MRQAIFGLILFISIPSTGHQQFVLIEKGNRQGLADLTGKELIPPVYDRIGWSKGELILIGGLIGYEMRGKWGLISVKNKIITPPDFFSLELLDSLHIKAAIKGKFSNRLFYGLINTKGETKISCRYFDIEPIGEGFLVYSYEKGKITSGYLGEDYRLRIPAIYERMQWLGGDLFAGMDSRGKWNFFVDDRLIYGSVDWFQIENDGIKVELRGKMGLLSPKGVQVIPPEFKEITFDGTWQTKPFDLWEVLNLELDSGFVAEGDSIGLENELFIAFLNDHQEVIWSGSDLFGGQQVDLKMVFSGFLVTKQKVNGKWKLSKTSGEELISNSDSIAFDGIYFFSQSDGMWDIYNRFGRKLNLRQYLSVKTSRENLIPVNKNGYWGLIDFQGQAISGWKFDDIGDASAEAIAVKYLDKWGTINYFGEWVISPDYDTIVFNTVYMIAKMGSITRLFDQKGQRVLDTSDELIEKTGYLQFNTTDSTFGTLSMNGTMTLSPIYEKVGRIGDLYYGYLRDRFSISDSLGHVLLSQDDGITQFSDYAEGFYKIEKDGKFGFIDHLGHLRIANRYDDAGYFNESYCAIKLNDGWGFVDKQERLVVQPLYDSVSAFSSGLAVVLYKGRYGIIDRNGRWVIQPKFTKILMEPGKGFILTDSDGKVGVADAAGNIVLTPQYEAISSVGNGLLVVLKNGKTGIMDVDGYVRLPFDYEQIVIQGDYFLMKKLVDN